MSTTLPENLQFTSRRGGINTNEQLQASFTVPPIGETVTLQVTDYRLFPIGAFVLIVGAGWFMITASTYTNTITVRNMGSNGNAAEGTLINSTARMVVSMPPTQFLAIPDQGWGAIISSVSIPTGSYELSLGSFTIAAAFLGLWNGELELQFSFDNGTGIGTIDGNLFCAPAAPAAYAGNTAGAAYDLSIEILATSYATVDLAGDLHIIAIKSVANV